MADLPARSVRTLVDLFRWRAERGGGKTAFTFLERGEIRETLTWEKLDEEARRVAVLLRSQGVRPGDRIPISYPSGLDYIVAIAGVLYAGAIAVPLSHGNARRLAYRLGVVVEDSGAACLLAPHAMREDFVEAAGGRLSGLAWLDVAARRCLDADTWRPVAIGAEDIAVLQYTSGSIGDPKACVVSHRNVLCNEEMIRVAFGHDSETVVVGWLPFYHDMGLFGNILQSVYMGCPCVLFSSTEFFREPVRWLEAITRYGGTTSGGPSFAYDMCARRIAPEQLSQLDLRTWRLAFNGAEPIQADTLTRFARSFEACGFRPKTFYPCYGLAEATLFVAGGAAERVPTLFSVDPLALQHNLIVPQPTAAKAQVLVSCGRAGVGQSVVIVDPERNVPLPAGSIGEIWVHGTNVAVGYFGKLQATRETFRAHLGDDRRDYLRTGDLGCLIEGELYVTGRLKDLIILRGRNYYPHDIERIAEHAHASILASSCAAFAVADPDGERLVLVCEVEHRGGFDGETAADAIRTAIADKLDVGVHTIVFVRTGQVPKTTSGKIRRSACRQLFLDDALVRLQSRRFARKQASVVTDSVLAERVMAAAAALLGRPAEDLPRDRSLPALGMDSLMMARLAVLLEAEGVTLPMALLHEVCGLEELIAHCEAHRRQDLAIEAPPVARARMPLSNGQRSLWLHAQLFPESPAYHLLWAARLTGAIDVGALGAAFVELQTAHDALRMRWSVRDGEPWQHWDSPPTALVEIDARQWDDAQFLQRLSARADAPLDPRTMAPIDAVLYARSDRDHVLLVRAHHIAMDLGALPILLREWQSGCGDFVNQRRSRQAPSIGDYVQRELDYLASVDAVDDAAYWRERLRNAVALPSALPRRRKAATDRRCGDAVRWDTPASIRLALHDLGRDIGCTSFEIHLALYAVMLAHWTSRAEVVIGVPFDMRESAGLSGSIGYCVNLLPIVVEVDRTQSFRDFARRVQQILLAARRHARLPLEVMAERLGAARKPGHAPFFDAVFVWRTLGATATHAWHAPGPLDATLAGGRIDILDLDERGSQFDFAMLMTETGAGLSAKMAFDPDVIDRDDVDRAAGRFEAQCRAVVDDANAPLSALALLGADERRMLVESFSGPEKTYPPEATLLSLLLDQAKRTPDAVALCGAVGGPVAGRLRQEWTYAQLYRASSRIAATLRRDGRCGRDVVVGVVIERSAAMVAAILAAIHAGGCYLPLDPDEPDERLKQLLEGSGCTLVLSTAAHLARAAFAGVEVLDVGSADTAAAESLSFDVRCRPEDLAYVIHTSGSTGLPKGVMIEHRSIVNRLLWMAEALELTGNDVFLQKTPVTFDVSVWELFLPLLLGARLVLLPPGGERDPPVLVDHMRRFDVTIAHFVPSMLLAFLAHLPPAARLPAWLRCVSSGEALEIHVRDRFMDAFGATALVNLYGPTEAAVDVTWHVVRREDAEIPIGRAVSNVTLRIFDADDNLVPIGTAGELCICGVQVARGYLNQTEMTARAFGVDPIDGRSPLYRTGDFARWRSDGVVEYLGRRDSQVKIRGRRVQLGEIEHALSGYPSILGVAVATRTDARGDVELVAFLLGPALPPLEPLLSFMKDRLPRQLIPSAFASVDVFPLTRSGKLDRERLPFEKLQRSQSDFQQPRTPQERTLCAIWASELSVETAGTDDNFFDLGGDSIRALRIVAAAARAQLHFTVADLFRRPTIRGLAGGLVAERGGVAPPPQPFELIPDDWRGRLPDDVEDAYPLSCVQQSLVFLSETSAVYEVYVTSLRIRGRFDPGRLSVCMRRAVQRHAFLRASFDLAGFAEGIQRVHRHVEVPFETLDWRGLLPEVQARKLHEWTLAARKRPFDWSVAPMLRFAVHVWSDSEFQFTLSDAALDGWCVASLITEVLEEYAAECEGKPWLLAAPVTRYADFIALERAAIVDEDARAFWRERAKRFGPGVLRRPERIPQAEQCLQGRVTVAFAAELNDEVALLARTLSVPVKSLLLAAHMRVLSALCGRRVVSGLEVNGRPESEDGDRVIGVFNNTVPLCLELDDGSWNALIRDCWRAEQELQPYRRYPYHHLRKEFGETPFDAVFVYTDFHIYRRIVGSDTFEVLSASASDQTFFALTAHFNCDILSDTLQLLLDFDPGQWSEASVRALAQAYRDALAAMVANPSGRHAQHTARIPAPDHVADSSPPCSGVLVRIGEQARLCPDRIAVVHGDMHVTYGALWRDAGEIAARLRERGLGPEAVVGVDMRRSPDLIAALLGVWRSGAAFLPLNPADPVERRDHILRNGGVPLVLTDRSDLDTCPVEACTLECLLASPLQQTCGAWPPSDPRSAAYVIYTSGSTGVPKGVVIQHDALANYLAWATFHYGLDGGDVPVHTATSFDLTMTSQIAPLTVGAAIRLMEDEDGAAALAAMLVAGPRPELIKLTPSHLDYLARANVSRDIPHPPATLVVGGEALRAESLRVWRRHGTRIFNEYGPTEATVGCCVYELAEHDPDHGIVPIGAAIDGMRLHVLDPWEEPVAPGLVGELWIAGAGLARGYRGAPAATADMFRPDPFSGTSGERLYRTGDLARLREDGLLEYVGRVDRQLKIRGFRIEPSEIEAALLSHPQVDSAAVAVRDTGGSAQVLAAYVVCQGAAPPGVPSLREHLAARLPEQMVPATFVFVDALPLTRNGKIDYGQLTRVAAPDARERLRALLERVEAASVDELAAMASGSNP